MLCGLVWKHWNIWVGAIGANEQGQNMSFRFTQNQTVPRELYVKRFQAWGNWDFSDAFFWWIKGSKSALIYSHEVSSVLIPSPRQTLFKARKLSGLPSSLHMLMRMFGNLQQLSLGLRVESLNMTWESSCQICTSQVINMFGSRSGYTFKTHKKVDLIPTLWSKSQATYSRITLNL